MNELKDAEMHPIFYLKYFILLLTKQNISSIIISTNKTKQT